MRYIDLRRNKTESYFDTVIKLGCGPNFVRNRHELFEQMIQEQGKEFWFRFWLTFCFHPDIREVDEFNQILPIRTTSLRQLLHSRFVQASTDAAISYCWKVVFEKPTPVGVTEVILSDGQFIDESYQFVIINFACALAGIFYKWLRAKTVASSFTDYWSIPHEYLDPDFMPGALEKFMIKHWGSRLLRLLDVKRSQVPWIRQRLVPQQTLVPYQLSDEKLTNDNADCLRSKTIAKRLKTWTHKVKNIRSVIGDIDEVYFGTKDNQRKNTTTANKVQTLEKGARKSLSQNEADKYGERSKNETHQQQKTKSIHCTKNKPIAPNARKMPRKLQHTTNKLRSNSKQSAADAMTNTDVSICLHSLVTHPFVTHAGMNSLSGYTASTTSSANTKNCQQSDHNFRVRKVSSNPSSDFLTETLANEQYLHKQKPSSNDDTLKVRRKIPVRKFATIGTRTPKFFHFSDTTTPDAPPKLYGRKSIRNTTSMPASKLATSRPTAMSTNIGTNIDTNIDICTGTDNKVDICTSTENKVGNIDNPCFQQNEVRTFDSHCTCTKSSLSVAVSNRCSEHRIAPQNHPESGDKPEITASYGSNNSTNTIRIRGGKQKRTNTRNDRLNSRRSSTTIVPKRKRSKGYWSDASSDSGSTEHVGRRSRLSNKFTSTEDKSRDKSTATTAADVEVKNHSSNKCTATDVEVKNHSSNKFTATEVESKNKFTATDVEVKNHSSNKFTATDVESKNKCIATDVEVKNSSSNKFTATEVESKNKCTASDVEVKNSSSNKFTNTDAMKCDKLTNTDAKRRPNKPLFNPFCCQLCPKAQMPIKNGKFGCLKKPKIVEKPKPCLVGYKFGKFKPKLAFNEKYNSPVVKAKSTNATMTDPIPKQEVGCIESNDFGSNIEILKSVIKKLNSGGQSDDFPTSDAANGSKRSTKITIDVQPPEIRESQDARQSDVQDKRYYNDLQDARYVGDYQTKRQLVQTPDRGPGVAEPGKMLPYFSTPSIDICVRNTTNGRPVVAERVLLGKNAKLERPVGYTSELYERRAPSKLLMSPLQCSCCHDTRNPLKICQKCADEDWLNPRYYCGIVCQTKHWFQAHEREHRLRSNL